MFVCYNNVMHNQAFQFFNLFSSRSGINDLDSPEELPLLPAALNPDNNSEEEQSPRCLAHSGIYIYLYISRFLFFSLSFFLSLSFSLSFSLFLSLSLSFYLFY